MPDGASLVREPCTGIMYQPLSGWPNVSLYVQSVSLREERLGCTAAYMGHVYRYSLAYILSRRHKERGASLLNRNEQSRPFQEREQLEESAADSCNCNGTDNSYFHPTVLKFAKTGRLLAMSLMFYTLRTSLSRLT
jgi:hypothetical protein